VSKEEEEEGKDGLTYRGEQGTKLVEGMELVQGNGSPVQIKGLRRHNRFWNATVNAEAVGSLDL